MNMHHRSTVLIRLLILLLVISSFGASLHLARAAVTSRLTFSSQPPAAGQPAPRQRPATSPPPSRWRARGRTSTSPRARTPAVAPK